MCLKRVALTRIHIPIDKLKKLKTLLVIDHSSTTAVDRVKHLRVSGSHCSRAIVNFTANFCQ